MKSEKLKIKNQNRRKFKLGEWLELKYGFGLPEEKRVKGNVPVYGSSGVVGYHNEPAVNTQGIVIGRKGNVGVVYFSNEPFYPIDTVYFIDSLKKEGDLKFFYYLLKTIDFKKVDINVGVPGLNRDTAHSLEVVIPQHINEQKRIADILSVFDDKIEVNNKIIKTLEEMAQEVFKEWFIKFNFPVEFEVKNEKLKVKSLGYKDAGGKFVDSELGKIPEGWEISKIGEKLTTILGGTPSTSNKSYWENGDIPWINSGAINDFPIINPTNFITKKGLENSAAKLMSVKTVVLPLVISIGKPVNISMLAKEMSGNQSVVGIVGNDKITPEYIYCWVQYKKQEIYGSASGGAQQHINKNIIDSTLILIPKGEILDSFNRKVVPFFDTIIKKAFENQTLAILRDLLLPKLMSGEILVNSE